MEIYCVFASEEVSYGENVDLVGVFDTLEAAQKLATYISDETDRWYGFVIARDLNKTYKLNEGWLEERDETINENDRAVNVAMYVE